MYNRRRKETPLEQDAKQYRRRVNAWSLYDWANSSFATTIMAAVFPIFFATVAADGLSGNRATVYWGYITASALFLAAIVSPLAGAAVDMLGRRKQLLLVSAGAGAAITGLLATVTEGAWVRAGVLFTLAQLGFVISIVCYDSLLPHVARKDDLHRVSTRGYAIGYLGGGLLLAINLVMILFPAALGIPSAGVAVRLTFVSVTLWWALFSIPLALRIPEPPAAGLSGASTPGKIITGTFSRLAATLKDISRHKEAFRFLVAFWIYNDGIGTIIKMATIYGTEIGIGRNDLIGALLLVQFIGIPCTFLFGNMAGQIGARRAILIGLAVYSMIAIGGYFLDRAWHFWALAILVGLVQGGTQALSRSLFATMIPPGKSAEWFGFYSVSHRFAGIAGPLVFALVGQMTGSSRISIVVLVVFFVTGGLLLSRVDLEKAKAAAN